MGETGDAELSEDVSETDSARPLRALMGMGWEGAALLALLEDILAAVCDDEGAKEWAQERGAEGGALVSTRSDALYESRLWVGVSLRSNLRCDQTQASSSQNSG